MSFASDMQEVALELLEEFGQPLTFTKYTISEYDPETGSVDPVTSATYTGFGHPSTYNLSYVDGTLIQEDDILLYLYTTYTPETEDTVIIDNVLYTVISIAFIKAQGQYIYYRLQLRK